MRISLLSLALILLVAPPASAQFSKSDFSRLSALLGTWQLPEKDGILYETWLKQSDTLLSGRGFMVAGMDTVPQETMQLYLRDGAIIFSPATVGQNRGKAVDFALSGISDSGFLFENPAHDWPTRIRYLPKGDSLIATVSGPGKRLDQAHTYRFRRAAAASCADLAYFTGTWRLRAWMDRTATGRPDVTAVWTLGASPDDSACFAGRVIRRGGDTSTREHIIFDAATRSLERTILTSDGSLIALRTTGWQGDRLRWSGTQTTPDGTAEITEEIVRKGKDAFSAVFYVRRNGVWTISLREELYKVTSSGGRK